MPDTGSPPGHEERDQGSVSPLSSHHASRSSTPGISSLDRTPRYLSSSPSLPRLRSTSLPPPATDMAVKLAYHLTPVRESHCDVLNLAPASAEVELPTRFPLPQHPPDTSSPAAVPIDLTKVNTEKFTSVNETIRLLRLEKYHQRRCHRAESSLRRLQIASARTHRLVCAARSVQHTLADCIKSEDKAGFVNLLHAFHDASEDCLAPQPKAATEGGYSGQATTHSFLDSISWPSRVSILELLSKLRHDGTFIANRLDCLSQKELVDIISDRGASRQGDSVFGSSARWSSRTSRPLGFVVDAHVDMVSSYSYGSALETLIFGIRGHANTGNVEHQRATEIWATVSASLLSKQKPGSEKFIPAVLDIWTSTVPWPAKARLELWILQTLQEGSFLLDQPSKQTFRARVEGRSEIPAEDELRAESFYTQAVDSLLLLLGEQSGATLIPPGALIMCRAIWEKLADSPAHQHGLPQFIVTRWLCSSFIVDAFNIPEAHGLLTDHYVPELARQRILREIATRTQKAVYEVAYSWKHGSKASIEVTQRVNTIMEALQAIPSSDSSRRFDRSSGGASSAQSNTENFVVVSAKDVAIAINALYPQRRPASVSSDYASSTSGLLSSASSVSGFSLFRNARAAETHSDLSPSWLQETHTPDIALDNSDPEHLSEAQSIREACLELEDFVTAGTANDWAVLAAPATSDMLCTMTERLLQVNPGSDTIKENLVLSSSDAKPNQRVSCLHALKSVLCKSEDAVTDDCLPVASSEEHLSHVWVQLEDMFGTALAECQIQSDFVGAHFWFEQFHGLRTHVMQSKGLSALKSLFDEIEATAQKTVDVSLSIENACEAWSRLLKSSSQLRSDKLKPLAEINEQLRDKMWYVSDVRTSAAYDETRSIASALRVMGRTKRSSRTRMAPPLRHWSGSKQSSATLQLKSEAQILELLSAKPEHGGPNKLSDDQSRITATWLERENIDNLCRGEERLHRFCMEIRKCVDSIVDSPVESSTISTNALFARDAQIWQGKLAQQKQSSLSSLYSSGGHTGLLSLQSQLRSSDGLSGSTRALSSVSSRDYLDTRSPTLASKSSTPFWSPAMTEAESPSSATSISNSLRQSAMLSAQYKRTALSANIRRTALDRLRERLTSLLLSDLTSSLFSEGSETDIAFWTGLGLDLVDRHLRNMHAIPLSAGERTPTMSATTLSPPSMGQFGFENAFDRLLQRFSKVCNPAAKLDCLYDIDRLLVPYMAQHRSDESSASSPPANETSTEVSVHGFRHLFSQRSLRPSSIFRDMQYIASLLPSSTLQDTPHGKAFCNAAVAIAGLKRDARIIMVETADSIIAYHSNNRGHGRSPSSAQQQRDSAIFTAPSRTSSAEDIARYSMADAAYLLQITAKEGDHVAQRELATLYLTHPELMDRIIAPFARPKEVFREELESRWRRNQDPNRCDPTTMCVAHHWMNLSSKSGDTLAKEYLRQREEMDSF